MNAKFLVKSVASLAVAAMLGLGSTVAFAGSDTTSGEVNIRQAVSVTGVRALDFGDIAKPSSGSNTVTLAATASPTASLGGAGDGFHFGGEQSGQFDISGFNTASYAWSVAVTTDFADGGLTLSAPTTSLGAGTSGTGSFGAAATNVYVGGTLTITSAAATGAHTDAEITLTVNYN